VLKFQGRRDYPIAQTVDDWGLTPEQQVCVHHQLLCRRSYASVQRTAAARVMSLATVSMRSFLFISWMLPCMCLTSTCIATQETKNEEFRRHLAEKGAWNKERHGK
jgi:hypothetical protein